MHLGTRTPLLALVLAAAAFAACAEEPPPAAPVPPAPPPSVTDATPPAPPAAPGPPAAAKRPVTDTYQGVQVVDDYRWLEKADDAEVLKWTMDQSQYARAFLDPLPGRDAIKARLQALRAGASVDYFYFVRRGDKQFAWKRDPAKEQPLLVILPSVDDPASARVVLDPNQLDASGKTTMDWYVPTLDGKKVAVSISKGGSESGDVHVYDTATGKEIGEVIPHVNGGTAGGSLAWNRDGSGFFYTRYPKPGERAPEDMSFYQQVYFHKVGTQEKDDTYSIGKDFPRIAEVELATSDDGKEVIATVENGDGGEFMHFLHDGKAWKQITKLEDKVTLAGFGRDGRIYVLSKKDAPRGKILRLPAKGADLAKAEVLVPESQATIRSFTTTKTKLYVVDLLGGPSKIRLFDLAGKPQPEVPIPPVATVGQIARLGGDDVLIRAETFLDPPAWYRFAGKGAVTKSKLFTTSAADFSGVEVTRETCKSKDGTEVPISVLKKKGLTLDGTAPAFLTGYGGYDISMEPYFDPPMLVWLEQGGVYAIANLRGGGEFGEAWHRAGMLANKQNVFDDFAACAQHLIGARYTSPAKLAAMGGSNGGLLMGAMITQHPDLFRAVISAVGIYDMLRSEAWPNGAFNVTEFGSVKDPALFKAMYAYSPYHHVTDGTAYPSVLFTTGLNDPRVDPSQSRKMAARLQAAGSKNPVLLYARTDAGHIGSSESDLVAEWADFYAFLFHELGVEYHPVKK
jgi:prolyl oligopeptidase